MPIPLAIPLVIMAGSAVVGAGANWYSQAKQRDLYRYQRGGYERQLSDYQKNVGRPIRYPELSYPGHIRALDTGISQSYASSVGTGARLTGQVAGGTIYASNQYGRSRRGSLFSQSSGRSSRWL